MNKIILLSILLAFGFASCSNLEKGVDRLEIAKQYYDFLSRSDLFGIGALMADSITTKDDNYKQVFSLNEYAEWLKWDSVFDPTYDILQIGQEDGLVKARVSKIDKRIKFLHEEPIVTNEIIRFDEGKIVSVERNNVIFNEETFLKNRDSLLKWIGNHHPELQGFLHDQTAIGGKKYLKAIELYTSAMF